MLSLRKNLFSLKNNAILHNRVILYFIFLVSLGNLFYLSVERDVTTIVTFLLVGFLTSFFSKNMLIILFVALMTSTILKHGAGIRYEGLENMIDAPEDNTGEEEELDLSNEKYLDNEDDEKRKEPRNNGDDEVVVENYEGEEDAEKEKGTKKTDTKMIDKSAGEDKMVSCIRKCIA